MAAPSPAIAGPASSGASTIAEEVGIAAVPMVPAGTETIITAPGTQVNPVMPSLTTVNVPSTPVGGTVQSDLTSGVVDSNVNILETPRVNGRMFESNIINVVDSGSLGGGILASNVNAMDTSNVNGGSIDANMMNANIGARIDPNTITNVAGGLPDANIQALNQMMNIDAGPTFEVGKFILNVLLILGTFSDILNIFSHSFSL